MYKGAVQLFSRALNVSEAELFKMMEQGQLVSAEVLPKVAKEFKKAATEGGAYALALKGLRVKEGQFMTGVQRAGKTIFNSGFEKGLSNLYGTLSEIFKNSGPQLKKLGRIFGYVFDGIAATLKVLEPVMQYAINNMELLFGTRLLFAFLPALRTAGIAIRAFSLSAAASWAIALAPITAMVAGVTTLLGAIDELGSLMDDDILGVTEMKYNKQFNILDNTVSDIKEKDGKFFKVEDSKKKLSSFLANTVISNYSDDSGVKWFELYKDSMSMTPMGGVAVYTYNNVFNNTQADDVRRNVSAGQSVATQPRGK